VVPEAICLVESDNALGECPIWCPVERVLWWIDVARPQLWKYDPVTGCSQYWSLPKVPGAIALRKSGGLLIAFRNGFAMVASAGGALVPLVPDGIDLGEGRLNDGKVDRAGRFWVGTLDRKLQESIGKLYRLGADRSFDALDHGFMLSNGLGWSPDNRHMYFAETHTRSIYRYDFDLQSGTISNRIVFAQIEEGKGGPDGLSVDADGGVWSVIFDRGIIHRYLPDGSLAQSVRLPIARPTSCTFGGDDLKTLYITSARIGLSDQELAEQPNAGGIWAISLGPAGQAESFFAG
jgi:sugar lactone lactonase YvrE